MATNYFTSASHWGAFRAKVDRDTIVAVESFEEDADPSLLIQSIPSAVHARSRIREPVVRKGYLNGERNSGHLRGLEPFVPVSWDQALDLVSNEMRRVRDEHGNQAIFGGSYGWASAGRINHARTLLHRFLNGFGGHVGQATNYSWGAAAILLPHIVGTKQPVTGPVTDWSSIVKNTDVMVMFGGFNLSHARVTSGGAGSHEYTGWLKQAAAAGVEFISISPIQCEATEFLDACRISIRPNTDTALILAIAHEIEVNELADRSFLDTYTIGYDRFRDYIRGKTDGQPKSAEWAAPITEVDVETIRTLARRMVRGRTMLSAAWSLQRADAGEQPYWALIALAAMIGQVGLPGGGFGFGYGSINGMGTPRCHVPTPNMDEGVNPVGISIPVARVADLLLRPGDVVEFNGRKITYPKIEMVYWAGGNPFHHHQDINKLLKAWSKPETIVVHEPWWTATARRADIVLPATTPFERMDLGSGSRDRFIIAMPQIVTPVEDARNDYDIFAALADRLGFRPVFTEGRDIRGWVEHAYNVSKSKAAELDVTLPSFSEFWRKGYVNIPRPLEDYVLFADFRADPERYPLKTPSGKIEIHSEVIAGFGYDECPGYPCWIEPKEWLGSKLAGRYPLHLLSSQPATRLHSQLDDGLVSRASKVKGREPLWINATDAGRRGIANGTVVRVYNDRGSCLAGAVVTDAIRPGVLNLATGAWYDPDESDVHGAMDKHGNPNVLTRDEGTSRLGQGTSAHSCLVEVECWDDSLPKVAVHEQPAVVSAST